MRSTLRLGDVFSLAGWLSLSRVFLAALFPCYVERPILALSIVAAAAVSDMLDGLAARMLNQVTATGAALDPITDKIFAASVMISLLVSGHLPLAFAFLLSVRELLELPLLIRLLRADPAKRARAGRMKANLVGKATTVLQFAALCAALFGSASLIGWSIATAICGSIAAWSYMRWLQRAWQVPRPIRSPRFGGEAREQKS